MADDLEWDADWQSVDSQLERTQLEEELRRELLSSHVLRGLKAEALGRRRGRDEVLFGLGDGRVAQVHLTWRIETDPRWPDAQVYSTFETWKAVPVEDR